MSNPRMLNVERMSKAQTPMGACTQWSLGFDSAFVPATFVVTPREVLK